MKKNSATFSSTLGFIAAAAGSAVGLGNIWRFPYQVGQNGGALFLALYVAFTLLLGLPLMITEVAFGRQRQAGPYAAYPRTSRWQALGGLVTCVSLVTLSFYQVITGWIVGYTWELISGSLLKQQHMQQFFTAFTADVSSNLLYSFLISILVAGIIRAGVTQGIEKCSKVLMPLLLGLLLVLIVYALTLSNTGAGLTFYLRPNLASLTPSTIYGALSTSCMTLSIGLGILTTYGAYLDRKAHLTRSALLVAMSVICVSFLAGLLVFPLIFHQGLAPAMGPGLLFVSLPKVFQYLGPVFGSCIGAAFFLLMLFASVTSSMSLLEVLTKYGMERWNWSRNKSVTIGASTAYILGIPSLLSFGGHVWFTQGWLKGSFMDTLEWISMDILLPLGGLLLSLYIAQRWREEDYPGQLRQGAPQLPRWTVSYVYFITRFVAPLVIGSMLVGQLIKSL